MEENKIIFPHLLQELLNYGNEEAFKRKVYRVYHKAKNAGKWKLARLIELKYPTMISLISPTMMDSIMAMNMAMLALNKKNNGE